MQTNGHGAVPGGGLAGVDRLHSTQQINLHFTHVVTQSVRRQNVHRPAMNATGAAAASTAVILFFSFPKIIKLEMCETERSTAKSEKS